MTTCTKHPDYSGDSSPDWNCRACRKIRKEAISGYWEDLNAKVEPARPSLKRRYAKNPILHSEPEVFESPGILVDPETWIHHGQTSELHKTVDENVKTLGDLIRVCEIDTSIWQIERWLANKTGDEKSPKYQIKCWLRHKSYLIDARRELQQLKELSRSGFPKRAPASKSKGGDYMLEVNIPDLHLGKLAWSEETGHGSYDSKIAEEVFEEALGVLLERTISYKFSEILLPLGNDLLHSDTKFGTTTAGTQLDTDSRYHKNFDRVRNLSIRSIERLRNIAPVKVVLIPGNHDTLSVWHLGDSLECFFHETEGVTIDNSPCLRKYHQFGMAMLMFTHGDKGKVPDYPLLMATEQSSMFGSTAHREVHIGHTHQLRSSEYHGVRVRTLSALCPPDAWHSERGFVGNKQSAEAFIWHNEEGLVGTAIYTI